MPLDLTPIRDALAKATPGPWELKLDDDKTWSLYKGNECGAVDDDQIEEVRAIVLLRNNASAMIDRIEELEKREETYREMVKEMEGMDFADEPPTEQELFQDGFTPSPKQYAAWANRATNGVWRSQRDAILSKLKERLA